MTSVLPLRLQQVEAHEGLGANPHPHVGYYEKALNPKTAQAVEHLVAPSRERGALASMAAEWPRLLEEVEEEASRRSDDVDRDHPVRFGCRFNYDFHGR